MEDCKHDSNYRVYSYEFTIWTKYTHRWNFLVVFGGDISKSSNLQHLRSFEEVRQLLLANMHFTVVHKAQEWFHVLFFDITQNHNGMLARICLEKSSEVWTAGRENHFVGSEGTTITCQCDIHKVLLITQMTEGWQDAGMEVIPAQTILLLRIWHLSHLGQQKLHQSIGSWHSSLGFTGIRHRLAQLWNSCFISRSIFLLLHSPITWHYSSPECFFFLWLCP